MNAQEFKEAVNALTEEELTAILQNEGLVIHQDQSLTIGPADGAFVIYELGDDGFTQTDEVKDYLLKNAESLIETYYQFNPISKECFNRELQGLFNEHGQDVFVCLRGKTPQKVIFVDDGQLIVEDETSPRFKYGIYLQIEDDSSAMVKINKAKNWLLSGTAYGDYISTNVCRFSAME
ncbi:hypothetical protein [Hydrogenovibrio kuenenii]|uniref:hypothetical protein n=1 Tax=Hydrogenovibrio kuenenii TaxID=63658 RepID=UPI000463924B|nr:hypothetical protein [Hydrogenovibrio kuenenii]